MGSIPLEINGKDFGWVQRRRFIWLWGPLKLVMATLKLPPGVKIEEHNGALRVSYSGIKPIPAMVRCAGGYEPAFDPGAVMRGEHPAMFTFTREMSQRLDMVRECSEKARKRFFLDDRRFPPPSYETHNLLWRGHKWRTYGPEERAVISGYPPSMTDGVLEFDLPDKVQTKVRNSIIGNGLHLPSYSSTGYYVSAGRITVAISSLRVLPVRGGPS